MPNPLITGVNEVLKATGAIKGTPKKETALSGSDAVPVPTPTPLTPVGSSYTEPEPVNPKTDEAAKAEAQDWIREREKAKSAGYSEREAGQIATQRTAGKSYEQVGAGERTKAEQGALRYLGTLTPTRTRLEMEKAAKERDYVMGQPEGFQRQMAITTSLAKEGVREGATTAYDIIDLLSSIKRLVIRGSTGKGDIQRIDDAEASFKTAYDVFKEDIILATNGEKPWIEVAQEYRDVSDAIATLREAEKGLGEYDYNYWKDNGISREMDLNNKKMQLQENLKPLIDLMISQGFR